MAANRLYYPSANRGSIGSGATPIAKLISGVALLVAMRLHCDIALWFSLWLYRYLGSITLYKWHQSLPSILCQLPNLALRCCYNYAVTLHNHRHMDCLFISLFWLTTSKTSELSITGPLWRESIGDRWIALTKGIKRELCSCSDAIIYKL